MFVCVIGWTDERRWYVLALMGEVFKYMWPRFNNDLQHRSEAFSQSLETEIFWKILRDKQKKTKAQNGNFQVLIDISFYFTQTIKLYRHSENQNVLTV